LKLLKERKTMTIQITDNPKELFRRWYKFPLEILENRNIVPDGDGGWIALSTACFLFERYVSVKFKIDHGKDKISDEDIFSQLTIVFKLTTILQRISGILFAMVCYIWVCQNKRVVQFGKFMMICLLSNWIKQKMYFLLTYGNLKIE